MRKILVVGGAGYIGSHMVKRLLTAGEQPIVFDNLCNGHRAAVPPSVTFCEGDLANQKLLKEILTKEKITHVMHFAAHAYVGESVQQPLKYYANNVAATVSLLQAMQETHVKFIVFSSSCATYGTPECLPITEDMPQKPINPYGETKLVIEKLLRSMAAQKQTAYAALRYFNAAGAALDGSIGEDHAPETHLIPLVLQVALGQRASISIFGDDYPTADGTCVRDYVHVEDIAQAHLKALEYLKMPGDSIEVNLGTGKPLSVKEIIDTCERVTGKKIAVKKEPRREGDPASLTADTTKAKKVLGWEAKHSDLETIIKSAWAWHQSHPHGYKK